MAWHTGQHMLSQALWRLFEAKLPAVKRDTLALPQWSWLGQQPRWLRTIGYH